MASNSSKSPCLRLLRTGLATTEPPQPANHLPKSLPLNGATSAINFQHGFGRGPFNSSGGSENRLCPSYSVSQTQKSCVSYISLIPKAILSPKVIPRVTAQRVNGNRTHFTAFNKCQSQILFARKLELITITQLQNTPKFCGI